MDSDHEFWLVEPYSGRVIDRGLISARVERFAFDRIEARDGAVDVRVEHFAGVGTVVLAILCGF